MMFKIITLASVYILPLVVAIYQAPTPIYDPAPSYGSSGGYQAPIQPYVPTVTPHVVKNPIVYNDVVNSLNNQGYAIQNDVGYSNSAAYAPPPTPYSAPPAPPKISYMPAPPPPVLYSSPSYESSSPAYNAPPIYY